MTVISPNSVCHESFFTLAAHAWLAADRALRGLDAAFRPALQHLAAQQTRLLDQPLLGRVRQIEGAVLVPDGAHDRGQPIPQARMRVEERQQGFVAECRHRHGLDSFDCDGDRLLRTTFESHPAVPGCIAPK